MPEYLQVLQDLGVDGIIVSDPGIFRVARRVIPDMDIHISTQANCTNSESAVFGVSREPRGSFWQENWRSMK